MPYSNVVSYKDIIDEAFSRILTLEENNVPKNDGSDGKIIKFDPNQQSLKQSMIVVVFAGMWLEAFFHQEIIKQKSKNQYSENSNKSYKEKLELIGISAPSILEKAVGFQKTRNDLIHEKVYFDRGEIKIAQTEAKHAYEIIEHVSGAFNNEG